MAGTRSAPAGSAADWDGVTTDLTPSERLALLYVRQAGPCKQQDLHFDNRMSPGSASLAVNSLVEMGLLARRPLRESFLLWDPDRQDPAMEAGLP